MTQELPPQALACLPPGLTQEEGEFVFNTEVLGLPVRKAAQLAGISINSIYGDHIKQAREVVRNEMRGNVGWTKEDATSVYKEAIQHARLINEPMTMIAGASRLDKLHGLDQPQKIDINLTASVQVAQEHVRTLSDADLVSRLGVSNIIDTDFYEVEKED